MEKETDLGTTIYYQEKMVYALSDELAREDRYMTRLKQEKKRNNEGFRRYVLFSVIMGWFCLFCLVFMFIVDNGTGKIPHNFLTEIYLATTFMGLYRAVYMFAMIFLVFGLIGLSFCLVKVFYYGRRRKKEKDNRDGVWRTYDDMVIISNERHLKLEQEHNETLAKLNANREIQASFLQKQLTGEQEDTGKTIGMDELIQAKLEDRGPVEAPDPGNPLKKTW